MKKLILLIFIVGLITLVNLYTAQAEELIQNSGFETGSLSPEWNVIVQAGPTATVNTVTDKKHSGYYSAKLYAYAWIGAQTAAYSEARLSQNITLPANATTINISWWQWASKCYVIGGYAGLAVKILPEGYLYVEPLQNQKMLGGSK